jgi:hypothetical protein
MTINLLGGVVQMCPKIVGDKNVTVVADVTVGCYDCTCTVQSTRSSLDDLLPLDFGGDRLPVDRSTVTE